MTGLQRRAALARMSKVELINKCILLQDALAQMSGDWARLSATESNRESGSRDDG